MGIVNSVGISRQLSSTVREFRLRAGLTQQQVADLAGVSVAGVRDLEQGRVTTPRAATLRRLGSALHLSRIEAEDLMQLGRRGQERGPQVRLRALGSLSVEIDGAAIDIGSERQRLLLGILVLSANVSVTRHTLVDSVWGTAPAANAIDLLQTNVSRLRRRLRPTAGDPDASSLLIATKGGYQLNVTADQLDVLAFRELTGRARRARIDGDFPSAFALFTKALALWHGPPLADLPELRDQPTVSALERERQAAVIDYAETAIELGRHNDAVPFLRQLTLDDPLHEVAHARLMIALAGSGQQAAALSAFDDVRRSLAAELGADPGPELREAHRRVLHQDIERAEAAAPMSAHRQLPPDLCDFTGREPELRALRDRLRSRSDGESAPLIWSIEGLAGVGKTRLAVHFAHQLLANEQYRDTQLYVDLHGHADEPPADPATVLASFLRLLGVPASQIPPDLAGRSALYRDRLHGKQALVLLDNAVSEEQVKPLLPANAGSLVLITSRRCMALDDSRSLVLDVFSPQDAEALVTQIVGERRIAEDRDSATKLVELCGRLPLAVALAARRLQARTSWTMHDLVARLDGSGDRLTELAAGSRRLRAVFELSYRALDPEEQRMFRYLGAHPGGHFTAASAAALTDLAEAEARALLDQLANEHLLTMISGERYGMHELVAAYARSVLSRDEAATEIHTAVERLLSYFLHATSRAADLLVPHRSAIDLTGDTPRLVPSMISEAAATEWLEAERESLVAAVQLAAEHDFARYAWQLAHELCVYLGPHGYIDDWTSTHEVALAAAVAAGDTAGEAIIRTYLGGPCIYAGRAGQARDHLERALELHQRAGDRQLETITLAWLDIVCHRLGQLGEALEHNRRAAALCAGDTYREGILRNNRGDLFLKLGRPDDALAQYCRALTLSHRANDVDNVTIALANIGDVHRRLGRYERAIEYLERAHAMAQARGILPAEAYVRHRLGNTYRELRRLGDADHHLAEALRIVRSVSGPVTESELLIDLGAVHREVGDVERALELVTKGLELAQERSERYEEARALAGLAQVHDRTGRTEIASEYRRRAHELFTNLGAPDANEISAALSRPTGRSQRKAG